MAEIMNWGLEDFQKVVCIDHFSFRTGPDTVAETTITVDDSDDH